VPHLLGLASEMEAERDHILGAPKDPDGKRPLERVFVFDLQLPPDTAPSAFGERVFVRFSHAAEPLGWQGWRRLRQLFLSRFNV